MRKAIPLLVLVIACGEPVATDTTTPTPTSSTSTTSTTSTTSVPTEGPSSALAAARKLWEEHAAATYHFTFYDDCGECMPEAPRLVTVWDGTVYDGRGVDVDSLFVLIDAAIADGRTVEVVYDPEFGYPADIWIDREARAYDGGTHLLVSDLQTGLPGDDVALADLDTARRLWEESRPPSYEFRTDILCGCPSEVTTWTAVDGDRIVDWKIERGSADVAPATIDQLLADLEELVRQGEVVEGGARITGSAAFDPVLGFPIWVGLDIEILDPDSELGELPPRMVFAVRDLMERQADDTGLEAAKARWAAVGPVDYQYELTIHNIEEGSFSDPYLVVVSGGVVRSVTLHGAEIDSDDVPAYSVDQLFVLIEDWQSNGFDVELLFDQRLGHPVVVGVNTGTEVEFFSIDALQPR